MSGATLQKQVYLIHLFEMGKLPRAPSVQQGNSSIYSAIWRLFQRLKTSREHKESPAPPNKKTGVSDTPEFQHPKTTWEHPGMPGTTPIKQVYQKHPNCTAPFKELVYQMHLDGNATINNV